VVFFAGEVVVFAGGVVSVAGEVVPVAGEVVSVAGEVVPVAGEVVSVAGEVVPVAGEVVPVAGEGPLRVLVYTRVHTCSPIRMRTHTHTCTHTKAHTHSHPHKSTRAHAHARMYAHAHALILWLGMQVAIEQAAVEKRAGDARLDVKGGPAGHAAAGPEGVCVHACAPMCARSQVLCTVPFCVLVCKHAYASACMRAFAQRGVRLGCAWKGLRKVDLAITTSHHDSKTPLQWWKG